MPGTGDAVHAYAVRSAEYAAALGSMSATAAPDRDLVERWASGINGPILDIGCGPGHWTAHLHELGHDATGMDPVPEFISFAHEQFPGVRYRCGALADVEPDGQWAGALAWYSLIHLSPAELEAALTQLRGLLRPGGSVLLGFFDGQHGRAFDHAITSAFYWSIPGITRVLEATGFTVEHHEQRSDPGSRPHGAVIASRPH